MTYPDPNDSSASQPPPGGYQAPPIEFGSNSGPVLDFPAAPMPPYGAPPQFGPPPMGYPQPPMGYPQPPMGYPQPPMYAPAYPTRPPTNGLAIGSLVTSVASLVGAPLTMLCFGAITIPSSIIGIVLGFLALNQIKQRAQNGRGLAIAGIVTGGLALLATIVLVLIFVFLVSQSADHNPYKSI